MGQSFISELRKILPAEIPYGDDAYVAFHVTVNSELRFLLPIVVRVVYHISDWYDLLL